jgi:hypothetical protein
VAARRIVVSPELAKLPFEIAAIPEQHVIDEFSTNCRHATWVTGSSSEFLDSTG